MGSTKSHYEKLSSDFCFLIIMAHIYNPQPDRNTDPNTFPNPNPYYSNLILTITKTNLNECHEIKAFLRQTSQGVGKHFTVRHVSQSAFKNTSIPAGVNAVGLICKNIVHFLL